MKKTAILMSLALATATQANAQNQGFDAKQIYFGGGIGLNDVGDPFDDAVGFQFFAGMPLPLKADTVKFAAEIGYMDSGEFEANVNLGPFGNFNATAEAKGLWGTLVASVPLQDNFEVLGRIGYDIGDDDGLMFGAGVGFGAGQNMDIRIEYVIRDNIDSLQANLVFRQ